MTTPLEQIKERLEKKRYTFKTVDWKDGVYSQEPVEDSSVSLAEAQGVNRALDEVINLLPSIIQEVEEQKHYEVAMQREKYEAIFSWLLGEEGDFPDLSQKPHYSFRTELRKRLTSLKEESK